MTAWKRSKSTRLLEMQGRKNSGSETWLLEPDSSFKQVSVELEENLLTDSTMEGIFTFSEKSRNIFGWLEWVVIEGREFSFVEKQ